MAYQQVLDQAKHRALMTCARLRMSLRPYTASSTHDAWLAGYEARLTEEALMSRTTPTGTFPKPASGPLPIADPRSFVAEPITADDVFGTDPEHVALTVNAYAHALVEADVSGEQVQQIADTLCSA